MWYIKTEANPRERDIPLGPSKGTVRGVLECVSYGRVHVKPVLSSPYSVNVSRPPQC